MHKNIVIEKIQIANALNDLNVDVIEAGFPIASNGDFNAVKEIAVKAIKKNTGARGLRSILENVLLKTMFDIPSQENVSEVIVDMSSVRGETQPIIVHTKNKQDKDKSKTSAA